MEVKDGIRGRYEDAKRMLIHSIVQDNHAAFILDKLTCESIWKPPNNLPNQETRTFPNIHEGRETPM